MVHVNLEKLGGLRVVECDGRIVRSDSAFALRDCVTSQSDARVIVLDLSEVNAIEGGGLGMLMSLQPSNIRASSTRAQRPNLSL
jgi:anti-anti-sigma regulatory factor